MQNTTASLPAVTAVPEETKPTTSLETDGRAGRSRRPSVVADLRTSRAAAEPLQLRFHNGPTTRKTIEVPEDYFFRVKMHALQRRIKEKDMWAEILEEYFTSHPNPE
jgi:hypothetical protein